MPPRTRLRESGFRFAQVFLSSKRRVGALLLVFLPLCAIRSEQAVFQIGTFDASSTEFSPIFDSVTGRRNIDYSNPKDDPVFVVGKSDPAVHWFSCQPGTANGAAGHREHPFTIEFRLDHEPRGRYKLKIALLAYSTRLPALQVALNGVRGLFHQDSKIAHSAGDPAVFFLPHYATSEIVWEFPARQLRKGENRLVLTAIDDSSDRDDVRPSGYPWPGNSAIVYDALRLEHQPVALDPPEGPISVRVEPTIFFRRQGRKLEERVDVFVRSSTSLSGGEVTLELADVTHRMPLGSDGAFGEFKASLWVSEFSRSRQGRLNVLHGASAQAFEVTLNASRKWTILVVPNEHLDIGYTDYEAKVSELQSRTISDAIEMSQKNSAFRFTLDGFWIAEQYLAGRDARAKALFEKAVKRRSILIPAGYSSGFTGFAGLENLIRSFYPSQRFLKPLGMRPEFALITDVPSYSWSLASVLAAAEIRYLAAASDAYRAPFLLYNQFHTTSPHVWEGPDGGRVLTWYARHYHQVATLFGMPPQMAQGRESLPRFLQAYNHPGYAGNTVLLYGTQVENTELHPSQASFVEAWNEQHAFPRLRYAGFAEAIEEISRQNAGSIPVHRGDGGPYWEDGLGANARTTALAKHNMDRVLSSEKLSTIAGLVHSGFRPDRERIDSVWRDLLLIDEHTWHADQSVREPGSFQSVRQGEKKDSHAIRASQDIEHLTGRSMSAIADTLPAQPGDLVIFNSLSWAREGLVECDLPKGRAVRDKATGERVGHEIVSSGNSLHRVKIMVPEVPPLGYRILSTEPDSSPEPVQANLASASLENEYYRIVLDAERGGIRGIYDKTLRREWVSPSSTYRFGGHLYVTGADRLPNRLVQFSSVSPLPDLTMHHSSAMRLERVWKTPFSTQARLSSTNLHTPSIELDIVLYDRAKRIDFNLRFQKHKVYEKEAVYFAFPMAMEKPRFRYATQNGFVDPARDMLPGAGLEWFTHQGWINVSDPQGSATLAPLDAPLLTLGDIARGRWPETFGKRPADLFSYVMNNYTPEGYQAGQGGDFVFRYAFSSGPGFDPVASYRLAAEAATPLELNEVTRNDRAGAAREPQARQRTTAPFQRSFLDVECSHAALVTWKLAEDGSGAILRFLEVGGQSGNVRVASTLWKVRSVHLCNALEEPRKRLVSDAHGFQFPIQPFGISTLRIRWDPTE